MIAATNNKGWMLRQKPLRRAAIWLFCFAYAGGGASTFNAWQSQLPADVEVCAVQLPGRESRLTEEPFTQLAPMLEALSEAFEPYCEIPFAFFGHCMGALIAFELARRLNGRQEVLLQNLFVAACRAPQLARSEIAIHELPE